MRVVITQEVFVDHVHKTNSEIHTMNMRLLAVSGYQFRINKNSEDLLTLINDLNVYTDGEFRYAREKFKDLETRIGKVETRLDKVEQRLDNIEKRLDKIEELLVIVVKDLANIHIAIDKMSSNLEILNSDTAKIKEKLEIN